MKTSIIGLLLMSTLFISGCVSYNSLLNYEASPAFPTVPELIANYRPIVIQTNDILHINVSSENQIASQPFSADQGGAAGGVNNPQGLLLNGYLVDSKGTIDFPTLGTVELGGLNLEEAKAKMQKLLNPFFQNPPVINIRLLNFRVNINGEVNRPGTFIVNNPSISIVEAITQAGDFTDYSRRDSILVIREVDGQRSFGFIDFNSPDVFQSPYFYLQQNDVVYIRPAKRKLAIVRDPATRIFTWISAITGTAAFIISIISLN